MSSTDHNFDFPLRILENDKLVLVPFDVDVHGEVYWQSMSKNPMLMTYVPWGPFPTFETFRKWYLEFIHVNNRSTLFAIRLKSSSTGTDSEGLGPIAGIIGYREADAVSSSVEIGFLVVLTNFLRNHIASQAIELLLDYSFDPPPFGLGFRKVHAQTHTFKSPVATIVAHLGGKRDGYQRWDGVVSAEKLATMPDRSYVLDRYDGNGNLVGHAIYAQKYLLVAEEWRTRKSCSKELSKL